MKLPSFITNFITFIASKFSALMHLAAQAASNSHLNDELVNAATDAVLAAENAGGTGADKFNAACQAVAKDFGNVALPIIQTVVQLAWAAHFKPSAPATPTV